MRNLTSGLARRLQRVRRDDRGAVAVIVAVLLATVLLGMCAMVIDVGQVYQNRAELQNGADAAALAVAKSCATATCDTSQAGTYADSNASALTSHEAQVDAICGTSTLGACLAPDGKITDCPAPPASVAGYVDVHTSTDSPAGPFLAPVFAQLLLGNSTYDGTTVHACAQAAWGGPAALSTVAVTFSACEWDLATQNGQQFAEPPPYPPHNLPAASYDQVLKLHTTSSNTSCPTEPAGADAPGNFGWTDDPNGNCTITISNGSYGGDTGNGVSKACKAALAADQANKTLVYVPIYVSVGGTGTNSVYVLQGFAAFVITGYSLPGAFASDWLNPANNCSGSDKCINGYFTQALIPESALPTGKNLGAIVISLTG